MDCRRHDDGILLRNKCLAQDTTTVDSTAVAPAVVEAVAPAAEAAPDTVGDLVLGLNTVWMLLAAALVFFMQPVLL